MPIFKSLFAISTLSVDMELTAVREKQLPERNRNSPVYSKCNLHLMLSDTKQGQYWLKKKKVHVFKVWKDKHQTYITSYLWGVCCVWEGGQEYILRGC